MSGRIFHLTRRGGAVMGQILVYLLIWAGLALLIAAFGIRFFWGEISVNQMLLNLVSVETDGGGGSIVWLGILGIGVVPLLITVSIALLHRRRKRRLRRGAPARPRHYRWIMRSISTVLVGAVVIGGTTAFARTVELPTTSRPRTLRTTLATISWSQPSPVMSRSATWS